jgi:hypothetical protein
MTKAEKVSFINSTIANERNELARKLGCEAYLNDAGQIRYRECSKGYARRATFTELLGFLHGQDIRALRTVL